jgi:uncharacterized protein
MERKILYFEQAGQGNTEATLTVARDRARELGIRNIVMASSHGGTARAALRLFAGSGIKLIAVTICAGYTADGWTMEPETRRELEAAGVTVLTGIHALGDDVSGAFEPASANNVVAQTLYRFCQGMKVCVEVALMASDAGLIPPDEEAIAIAGTSDGADTAIVLTPSYPRKFKQLKVHEILAMPR